MATLSRRRSVPTAPPPEPYTVTEPALGRLTNEVRTVELHLSEVQTAMQESYALLLKGVEESARGVNAALTALTTQVEHLSRDRSADAQFIADQKAEQAARAHDAELERVRLETRAAVVLEHQTAKDTQDAHFQAERAKQVAKQNRILYAVLSLDIGAALTIVVSRATGTEQPPGSSVLFAAIAVGVLVLVALGIALWIKPEAGI